MSDLVRTKRGYFCGTSEFNVTELDAKAEEIGAWLRARVPLLSGPCQSSLFVKYVLREMVFGSKEGIWVTAGRKVAY